jgi:hypothetical protein
MINKGFYEFIDDGNERSILNKNGKAISRVSIYSYEDNSLIFSDVSN